ncbi:MAG: homoserine dehydrogenase [Propionibacteriaceae bacterium]|nr:homoserine dehydrogenase [Propionibacteriaceae bacterium]
MSLANRPLRVALLGCGVVGAQVARILTTQSDELAIRVGRPLELVGIAVRDITKPRDGIDAALLTNDAQALVTRGDIDIVVELIGGVQPAESLLRSAMAHGASVVTANKALLGARAGELFETADQAGVDIYFEAAVAGAVPIIRPLRESLVGDEITTVMGIVNGTTNFILDKMTLEGMTFADALTLAQQAGYAEADPTADVEGYDAAAKAAILARLAFHTPVTADQVYREGITALTPDDIKAAAEADCVLKLLAIAEVLPSGSVSVRVHPAMVPLDHPLASVHGAYNAIFILARQAGRLMFLGPGAGGVPTASAVIGDLVTVARNRDRGVVGSNTTVEAARPVAPVGEAMTRYHLRFSVVDAAGVLATVANVFADRQVSVATLRQTRPGGEEQLPYAAELHMLTHSAREADQQACVADLTASPVVGEAPHVLRLEGM